VSNTNSVQNGEESKTCFQNDAALSTVSIAVAHAYRDNSVTDEHGSVMILIPVDS